MTPRTLSCGSIIGTSIKNRSGKNLGDIKEMMVNTNDGSIAYVVLSFGGFLGLGDKYFAIPFEAFSIDSKDENFILNVDEATLKNAPGFDKDNWPTAANAAFIDSVYNHYGYTPRWRESMVTA